MKPEPAFVPEAWCADRLGLSISAYRNRLPTLEADGYPQKDRLIGLRQAADVNAWIEKRRRLHDAVTVPGTTIGTDIQGVNYDQL